LRVAANTGGDPHQSVAIQNQRKEKLTNFTGLAQDVAFQSKEDYAILHSAPGRIARMAENERGTTLKQKLQRKP
jgi:hypothetical protein